LFQGGWPQPWYLTRFGAEGEEEIMGTTREQRSWEADLSRVMTRPPIKVGVDTNLAEAAEKMLRQRVGALLVTGPDGQLAGILTEGDFAARRARIPFSTFSAPQVLGRWLNEDSLERVYAEARRLVVGDVMTSPVHSVTEEKGLTDVLRLMLDLDLKHVPVVRGGHPIGMIARHDLLKMMLLESTVSEEDSAADYTEE